MARTKLIAANWKMHAPPKGSLQSGTPYFSDGNPQIVVFPTFIDLQNCIRSGELIVGAQCGRPEPGGAFTGDVSIPLLKEFGCSYVLCGHSERRKNHGESDAFIAEQVAAAMKVGLTPILCIGETADERKQGIEKDVIRRQLQVLDRARTDNTRNEKRETRNYVIAYEPVWAIGTGKTATPAQAQEMHAFIRSVFPENVRDQIRILYGGSVKADNARAILAEPDIDGALVGSASLDPEEFRKIVASAR